jgi:periplasmic nitrate reductase NapD
MLMKVIFGGEMPISSVVISCRHDKAAAVEARLKKMPQLEIHHRLENGRLIAVLETETVDDEVALFKEVMQTDGVFDVRLAYHNFEDLQELQS